MKKLFLSIAVVFSLLSVNAQKEGDIIISAGGAKDITLGNNMKVVLVQAKQGENELKFSKDVTQKLDVVLSGGSLEIRNHRKAKDEVVYLIVDNVAVITVGENTSLSSDEILIGGDMRLYMNTGASAKLKTTARVSAFSLGDFDVRVKSTPLQPEVTAGVGL